MAKYGGKEISDGIAVVTCFKNYEIYLKKKSVRDDVHRWRGMDDPKYPEIREGYERVRQDVTEWEHIVAARINEYIDSRIRKVLWPPLMAIITFLVILLGLVMMQILVSSGVL